MAFSNHRYDTADYKRIDPLLGSEDDFKKLCTDAHKLGMKIILDGVFSHTGSNSVYFDKEFVFGNGAVSNENSPYREWFMFQQYPHKYTSWWGIDTLPCVDEMNPSYMDYIIFSKDSVIEHWLNLGTGCATCLLIVSVGIYMIRRGNREIRTLQENGHG